MGKTVEQILENVYYNLNSPASYSGIKNILDEAQKQNRSISQKDVKEYLLKQRTYTLYHPIRKKFPRLRTIPSGLHTDWQCDLCIMDALKDKNDGYRYLLVCIDVLSRKIFVSPARTKKFEDMIEAFEKVFKKAQLIPHKIYTDRGVEFCANRMKRFYEEKDISKYEMNSPNLHAAVAERANRTIKGRLYKYFSQNNTVKWIDVIDKIVDGINNTKNRITGKTPNSFTFKNAQKIRDAVYKEQELPKGKTKYRVGDIVRITKEKSVFAKEIHPNFTDELFKISNVNNTNPASYQIVDSEQQIIKGVFYDPELVKTTKDTTHRIAEVLKTRTRRGIKEHFVRWVGYSDKFNSWIKDSDLIS